MGRDLKNSLRRISLALTVFIAAGFAGRATIIDGEALSLIWPAAGIAAFWVSCGNRRTWATDLTAVAAASYLVNFFTGASSSLSLVFVVTNVVQVYVFVLLTRQWLPSLWGFGGTEPMARLREVGLLAAASTLSCLLGATLGSAGLAVVMNDHDVTNFLVWWGRNSVAMIVVVTCGVLAGQPLMASGSARGALSVIRAALTPRTGLRGIEAAALVGTSAGVLVLLFLSPSAGPLAFLVLIMSVWAGLRFAPLAVCVHGMAMGATGIAFTLNGFGPFAAIESLHYRALVAQVFVAMAVLKGLALAFSRDERDRAIVALAASRRAADERAHLLDAVLESMKEGITVVDGDGSVLLRNTAARELVELVGPADGQVRPAEAYPLFHPDGLALGEDEMPWVRALAGEIVEAFDVHLRLEEGVGDRVLESTARPLNNEDPTAPLRALVNTRDVTLDRQHRDTLASFAGVVAHDLQNPLSIVKGWSEALGAEFAQGPVSAEIGSMMVGRIQDSATHMQEFIGDLMSYTIARDQTLRQAPVDLTAMVRSLADLRSDGPGAPLIGVSDGLQVWADTGLVRQLLDNLIGNAVKYCVPGVRPRIEITGTDLGDWLEVRVADNGIGIPENQREAVFESFHRAHGGSYSGTGLGLAICRRIVDRHGGTIHVAPGPRGQGCTLVFLLPRLAPTRSAVSAGDAVSVVDAREAAL